MQFVKFTLFNLWFALCIAIVNPLAAQSPITANLQERMSFAKSDDMIRINIRLSEQYDSELLRGKTSHIIDREERRSAVVNELKTFTEQSQKGVLNFLNQQEKSLKVDQIRPLWIVNLINCYATPDIIEQIAQMPGVERVDYDQMRQVLELNTSDTGDGFAPADKTYYNPNIAWNVNLVNAPQVWEEGYTGEGIIVAVLDTGVNGSHQDLAGRMWTHINYPNHGYNFVDNNYNTNDVQSHGTHCAGTVAGNGTAGTTTGVAPGATIMALKVLSDSGGGTEAGVWAAIQFSVDYGAHVMSLSLGWQHSWNPDRAAWRIAMVNAMNAGVVAAVAAGNEGTSGNIPSNIRTPGDCPAPWTHPDQTSPGGNSAVVTVGSTTNTDAISSFSSRGPVTWQNIAPFNDYAYNPGSGLIIPDVVAPGSNILSLSNTSNTGYTTKSGTSMATPAVAGLMALMLSKNPNLTPEQISQILEETAMPLSASKSNTFGSGRIDAVAALQATPFMGVRYLSHQINDSQGNNDGKINAGETIQLTLTLENPTEDLATNVSLEILTDSEFITFTQNTATLGDFEAGEVRTFTDLFSFEVSQVIPGKHEIVFVLNAVSPDGDGQIWRSNFSETAHAPLLEFEAIVVDDSQQGNNNGRLDPGETAILNIPIRNNGQVTSSNILFNLSSASPWVFIHQQSNIELAGLAPNATSMVSVQITALQETPLESLVELQLKAYSGLYEFTESASIRVGEAPVYSLGNIPSTFNTAPNVTQSAIEPGLLTVNIPQGAVITGIDVEYKITSQGGAWMSEQRSFLRCVSEGGISEGSITQGPSSNSGGTHTYNRNGLNIANNVEGGGDIQFELHVFRTWGGSGSNTQYAMVPNNSWKVIVHYILPKHDVTFKVVNQLGETVENATIEIAGETLVTNQQGEAGLELSGGSHIYNISAPKHKTGTGKVVFVTGSEVIELPIERAFGVAFDLTDPDGNSIEHATITINEEPIDGYEVEDLNNGLYNYLILADGFRRESGAFFMNSQDVMIEKAMQPAWNITFNISGQWGDALPDAVLTFNGEALEPGVAELIEVSPGTYNYAVAAQYYLTQSGSLELINSHLEVNVLLIADGTSTQNMEASAISIYPNPAQSQFTVNAVDPIDRISIWDMTGRLVYSNQPGVNTLQIDTRGFSSGLYLITLVSGQKITHHKLEVR